MSKWQPIQTIPEYKLVLISNGTDVRTALKTGQHTWNNQYGHDYEGNEIEKSATHWMPLPVPPKSNS